jgi:hypothetical protein
MVREPIFFFELISGLVSSPSTVTGLSAALIISWSTILILFASVVVLSCGFTTCGGLELLTIQQGKQIGI